MGLFKALSSSVKGTMDSQWRQFIYCDSLMSDAFVTKGKNQLRGNNIRRSLDSENRIPNGSIICIADGQCMLLIDNGKLTHMSDEPGEFVYDDGKSDTVWEGGKGLAGVVEEVSRRFEFGGLMPETQRVFYINTRPVNVPYFYLKSPMPVLIKDAEKHVEIEASLNLAGTYIVKIQDPALFFSQICGDMGVYKNYYFVSDIRDQLDSEISMALMRGVTEVTMDGVRGYDIADYSTDIISTVVQRINEKWLPLRGMVMIDLFLDRISLKDADFQFMKAADVAAALAGAKKPESWKCSCGAECTTNFCMECGAKRPVRWTCRCGAVCDTNFCQDCGSKRISI